MGVLEAVERDLVRLAEREAALAVGTLAATARELASLLDDPGNSATSKSMCARALREAMDRLWELAPPAKERSRLDELNARRAARLGGGAAPSASVGS